MLMRCEKLTKSIFRFCLHKEKQMQTKQAGFTLIELVVVIVILGILSAVALPKFIDLSNEARTAAVQGVAAGITAGSALNYGARKVSTSKGVAMNAANVCTKAVLDTIMQGGVPAGYNITGTGVCNTLPLDGTVVSCSIADANASTVSATASIVCANP
jgi:MSHA pilin protein MshA